MVIDWVEASGFRRLLLFIKYNAKGMGSIGNVPIYIIISIISMCSMHDPVLAAFSQPYANVKGIIGDMHIHASCIKSSLSCV